MKDLQEQSQQGPLAFAGQDEMVLQGSVSVENVRVTTPEEQDYETPFATLTWKRWLDLQTQAVQCFSRFVRAVEERRADHALMIGLEMQEITTALFLEAYAQSTNIPMENLPAELLKYVRV